jgi:hypothetical protein
VASQIEEASIDEDGKVWVWRRFISDDNPGGGSAPLSSIVDGSIATASCCFYYPYLRGGVGSHSHFPPPSLQLMCIYIYINRLLRFVVNL